jgi:hypothetical protein
VDTSLAGLQATLGTAIGDLDSDGLPDVALTDWHGAGAPDGSDWTIDAHAYLLPSRGATFSLSWDVRLPIGADQVAIGDIDGDGRNDIVLSGERGEVVVMRQSRTAPGSFGAPAPLR